MTRYKLLGTDGFYYSSNKNTLGGNKRLKIHIVD